jgi:hypothetical protein
MAVSLAERETRKIEREIQRARLLPMGDSISLCEFLSKLSVALGSDSLRIVKRDRFAEAWGLSESYGSGDDRLVGFFCQVRSHFLYDLPAQIGSRVVHGKDDALNLC